MESDVLSGGLALFCYGNLHVENKDRNERFIDAQIHASLEEPQFHFPFVYGEPHMEHHHRMWCPLSALRTYSSLSWMIIGDFNEELYMEI